EMEADRIAEQVMRMPDLVCPTCVKDALQYQSTNTGIPVQLPYFLQKFRLDIRSFFWDSFIALSNLVVFFESFAGPAGRKGSDINVPGSMEIIVQTGTRRL
ncbi:MAG: hypothetical protein JXJ04_13805, partial [Spirochaetales bacterium]|nr:hypothetical protein [Spirochaetales bacterium]